ncbi:MAG: hypothetical protein Q9219_003261 [cf. Caloplaca sp. 3 TL-2023]
MALSLSCILVSIFQCVPIHMFWDTLAGRLAPARCINVQTYFLVGGGINTFTDFVLLAAPIPLLWRLRTGTPQKWLLTAIFTVGLTVCVVSVVHLVVISKVDESDITWNNVSATCWTAAEPSTAVVSACLPSLRPLFANLIRRRKSLHRRNLLSWRSSHSNDDNSKTQTSTQGSFNRLHEFSGHGEEAGRKSPWRANNVTVFGGTKKGNFKRGSGGGHNLGDEGDEEEGGSENEIPLNRIRAKTEVVLTISERVDWRDDLF